MELAVKYELIKAIIRTKKIKQSFSQDIRLHMAEAFCMLALTENKGDITVPELQKELRVNKSAISQMLASLEEKEFISREINPEDRRRIDICITPKGYKAMTVFKTHIDPAVNEIFTRFGEDKAQLLIDLFEELVEIFTEVHVEMKQKIEAEEFT